MFYDLLSIKQFLNFKSIPWRKQTIKKVFSDWFYQNWVAKRQSAEAHWLNLISTCLSWFCLPKSKHWIRDEKLKCARYQRVPTSSVSSAWVMTLSIFVSLVRLACATDTKQSTRTVRGSVTPLRWSSEETSVWNRKCHFITWPAFSWW